MVPEIPGKIPSEEAAVLPEYKGSIIDFEGVKIQWEKGEWRFNHPEVGVVTKPTYPLLNPRYWGEIVRLLKHGKTAAGMMMGPYGVYKRLKRKDTGSADALFDEIKQRSRKQNFVVLIHPKDIKKLVNFDRLPEPYKTQLRDPKGRSRFYAGPQHVVLPVKKNKVHPALVNEEDQTIACFWVPDHFGFEGMVRKAGRGIMNSGLLGGGSLNIHGKDPYYDKNSLYKAMAGQKEWLGEIDFIIFDDIAEAGDIGRSHTMTRYLLGESPKIIRLGSVSAEKVRRVTGHDLRLDGEKVRYASSKTSYSSEHNTMVDTRVEEALQRTQRFEKWIKQNF